MAMRTVFRPQVKRIDLTASSLIDEHSAWRAKYAENRNRDSGMVNLTSAPTLNAAHHEAPATNSTYSILNGEGQK